MRANRGSFFYSVPASISDLPVALDETLLGAVNAATEEIRRFDQDSSDWGVPFSSVLLRSESAASSQIENLTAGARRIALASLGDTSSRNATMIAYNSAALRAAIDLADDISPATVRAMHERLQGGDDPASAGVFRTEPVWIGGSSPVTASFVAAHHDEIERSIEDLVTFCRRDDMPPLAQAAIAHAQFETVHPFTDGNGRTGRALVSSILRAREVTRGMPAPISSGLLTDTRSYFDALTAYRAGDLAPIVRRFVAATKHAVANAAVLRDDALDVRRQVLATAARRTSSLVVLADLCGSEPALSGGMLTEAGVSTATAYRLLNRLDDAGIVHREKTRNAVWTVPPLIAALDRFAARAGRRARAH